MSLLFLTDACKNIIIFYLKFSKELEPQKCIVEIYFGKLAHRTVRVLCPNTQNQQSAGAQGINETRDTPGKEFPLPLVIASLPVGLPTDDSSPGSPAFVQLQFYTEEKLKKKKNYLPCDIQVGV